MLIKQIRYKAEEIGINVILQDESHTSKCSFLDNESVEHQETYMGERIRREVCSDPRTGSLFMLISRQCTT